MKKNKEETKILTAIIFISCVVLCILINVIRANLKRYEYYKGEEHGISKECYINERDVCMCKINNVFTFVDEYYEVE